MKLISYTLISALISFWFGNPSEVPQKPASDAEICQEQQPYSIERALAGLVEYQAQTEALKKTPLPMRIMVPSITATKTFMLIAPDIGPAGPSPG
ncbi:MAG: hypothetical protein SH848_19900, partial [Saprospiraceae bacterium]|nr:hypothetical protein [Saprospiraceae bacterium]MDZ4706202.1 hypothetical protein [Saprospiraceae bacterium]